jgi:DNA-binding transcriptional regulator YiaG
MNNGDYFQHCDDVEVPGAPFHYKRCGLDNIYLTNGFEEEFDEDGERYVSILDVDDLHKAIGVHLVTYRKTLAPKEIRFLRRTLDLTQAEMGRLIDQSAQQIARWEKGESNISGPADRLLRLMFVGSLIDEGDDLILPLEFLNRLDELDSFEEERLEFQKVGDEWLETGACQ